MRSKFIQIKNLKPGDMIKTFHDDQITFRKVVDVWNTEVKMEDRYVLEFTNGTKLRCSKNHPIMIVGDNGIEQKLPLDLTEFDEIITDSGTCYLFSIIEDTQDINYIDIEVEDTHTFFAASDKNDKMILTHNSQGGVRNGAATLFYPIFHLEVEDLLVLKNNKGIEENRVRHMDYGVQFSRLFYQRLIQGGDITLFSPNDVPELYEAFFNDQEKFEELYTKAENNPKIRKKKVKALDLFSSFMQERKDTGRIYLMNVDHANTHSSFDEKVAPVKQSNLCLEITLSTKPLKHIFDEEGRIALCTLSAINWGLIKDPSDFEKPCTLAVRGLDALLSYQNYPVKAAELSTMEHRPLGVGIINFAYWLAKNNLKYTDDSALAMVDQYAEAWSYYLIKASVDLAKEFGPCGKPSDTKYAKGIVPIDTRKRDVDELVPHQERMHWDNLRSELKQYGIRNATLMAIMPSESSSQISNATNGIEPPRSYISIKQSKDGVLKQVVPEFKKLKNKYELLWDQQSPEGYIKICAILQKYIDQAISTNTSYNPQFYEDEKIPMSEMLKHLLMVYKYGLKTLYYFNTLDGQGEINVSKFVEEVKPESNDEVDCDSCVI